MKKIKNKSFGSSQSKTSSEYEKESGIRESEVTNHDGWQDELTELKRHEKKAQAFGTMGEF